MEARFKLADEKYAIPEVVGARSSEPLEVLINLLTRER
jgi:hypothetical protein